jgi:hypothetical protein
MSNFLSRLPVLFHADWPAGFAASARSLCAWIIVTRPITACLPYLIVIAAFLKNAGQNKTPLILQPVSVGKDEERQKSC